MLQIIILTTLVEGSCYRDHCNCLMDAPSQLKIIFPFFDLQKMSGQGVQTHPPMVLLVLLSNVLMFSLGPFLGMLTFFDCVRAFYSARSFVPFNGGKTFWLVMMVLRWWQSHHYPAGDCQRLWEGWFAAILVFSLCRWRRAGGGKSPEVTQEGPVEHAFGKMNNDWPRDAVKTLVWDAIHWVRIGHPDRGGVSVPW